MTKITDAFTIECEDCGATESFISRAERTPASVGWSTYRSERFQACGRHMVESKHDLCPPCTDAFKEAMSR